LPLGRKVSKQAWPVLRLLFMTAFDLIAHDLPSLNPQQTGRDAFHLLNDHHIKHLPVVDGTRLIGIISEEDVFNHKLHEEIGAYNFSSLRPYAVQEKEHYFEVMRKMGENRLTIMPVVNEAGEYVGLISQQALFGAFADSVAFSAKGSILVLEMSRTDYSLVQLMRLIENEDAQVINFMITSAPAEEVIELTLKINRDDLTRVLASLERHGYIIKETFADNLYSDGLKERYELLMNYLNI
jgi:acetoin utilization protein AcuB